LSTSTAASTYLTQANATSTYLPSTTAASTYLTQTTAASTYLTPGTAASTYLTQTTAASTYLTPGTAASTYVPQSIYSVAGKNAVINGNFDIWQRGTSFTNIFAGQYTADRASFTAGGSISCNVTRDASVPNAQSSYSIKYTQTANTSGLVEYAYRHWFEIQNVLHLVGKPVTISFWYKSNKTGTHEMRNNTFANSSSGAEIFGSFTVVSANTWEYKTLVSSAWAGITSFSSAPNAHAGFLDIGFKVGSGPSGFTSLSTNDYFQISQLQVEVGSVATVFSRAGGDIQGEIAACQRYYWRNIFWNSGTTYNNNVYVTVMNPVQMRATPSVSKYANGDALGWTSISTIAVNDIDKHGFNYSFPFTTTSFLSTRCFLYLEASAEL
jgi:hypothetical protein